MIASGRLPTLEGVVVIALLLLIPLAELAVIVTAAESFGLGATLAALVLFCFAGAWLMRREGWAVWRRANEELAAGRVPTTELLDGAMILAGGALMLVPGFITGILGLLLLIPPVRALLRPTALRAMARRTAAATVRVASMRGATMGSRTASDAFFGTVIDVDATQAPDREASARVVRVEPLDVLDDGRALGSGS